MFGFKLLDPLTPQLIAHIAAGAIGIVSGAVALFAQKGAPVHRAFGTVFVLSMLIMAAMGIYVALTITGFSEFPKKGVAVVAALAANLVASAWLTVRRKPCHIGAAEKWSMSVNFLCAAGAAGMAVLALTSAEGLFDGVDWKPYLITASSAAFIGAADLRYISHGGLSGRARLVRHLWRMCLALFLAAAFFFIGQQRIMPASWQGSPILALIALTPLALMGFWLVRMRRQPFP